MFVYKKICIVDGKEEKRGDWYQVGYYEPEGEFYEVRKYREQDKAEEKVNHLNGYT